MFIVTVLSLFFYDLNCPRLLIMIFFLFPVSISSSFELYSRLDFVFSSLSPLESLISRNNWTIKHLFFLLNCSRLVVIVRQSRIRPWNEPKSLQHGIHSVLNYVLIETVGERKNGAFVVASTPIVVDL